MSAAALVLVEPVPRVRLVEVFPSANIHAFDQDFAEVGFGVAGQVGFIDWLRPETGRILGLRIWLHRDWFPLAKYFRESSVVRAMGEGVFELMFRHGVANPELSCDQAFDETRAYVGPSGSLLFAISTAPLSAAEVDDLGDIAEYTT